MVPELMHLEPRDAVTTALARPGMEAALDRFLVQRSLDFFLDRVGDPSALGLALVDAVDHVRMHAGPWAARWRLLLELVQEARRAPSAARDRELAQPTGRSADVLRALLRAGAPTQPSRIAEVLGLQRSQVSTLLAELDTADLVDRHRDGRDVWVVLTARGRRVAALLVEPEPELSDKPEAAPILFWLGAQPYAS